MTVANDGTDIQPGADWLAGAVATLRARLWAVVLVAALFVLVAVIWLRTTDYTYTAAMRVAAAPTSARESASIGALTSLATLTGSTLEPIPVTPFRLFVEGIGTREVATRLAADDRLMRRVFADEWDARYRRWRRPEGLGIRIGDTFDALVGSPAPDWTPPSPARLQAFIAKSIRVAQSPKTPVVTISIDSVDRSFAKDFLTVLHTTTDAWLRERTLDRTANNIAYIDQRLPTITLADHRQALFATLSDQQQRQMMARNPAPYAAESLGGPTVSTVPTSPRQVLVLVVALALGGIVGVLGALVIPRRRRGVWA